MSRIYCALLAAIVATTAVAHAAQYAVGQRGRLFSPGKITVKVGDSVTFLNDDNVVHHVYSSTKGNAFNIETMKPKEKVSRTFTKPGRVDVRCGLHPGMRLIIVVE